MKKFFIILFLLPLYGFTSTSIQEQIVVHSRAGIIGSVGCERLGVEGENLAHRWSCEDLVVISEVSNIEMKTGIDFGVEYLITPSLVDSCFKETRYLEHPAMRQPNGNVTTQYSRSYYVGNCDNDDEAEPFGLDVFSWYIEEDWEAVTGKWVFKVLIDNKVVIQQEFTLH